MLIYANYFTPENAGKKCCEKCNFVCSKKSDWDRHILTRKHKNANNANVGVAEIYDEFTCELCNKKFKHSSSLCRHKKTCKLNGDLINPDLVLQLLNQNKQLQEQIIDLCKEKSITNYNNNNNTINNNSMVNSNNKTFNLQVFLNETCKDAMNIMDFVDSLQIQLSDLENVGRNGFVAGISDIILKNLKALDITQRPIHCSDQKREIVYVKDDNVWHNDTKEQPENQKLKKAIKYIAHKNTCLIKEWKAKYPDCGQSASRKSDLYNKIVYEAMSLDNANAEKIIKRITKEIGIDKTNL
jgi:hypothetical protein